MNSVLQCLTHTPPLAELFLSSRALGSGPTNGFDPLGVTRELMQRSLQHRGPIVSPVAHAKNLRRICRRWVAAALSVSLPFACTCCTGTLFDVKALQPGHRRG